MENHYNPYDGKTYKLPSCEIKRKYEKPSKECAYPIKFGYIKPIVEAYSSKILYVSYRISKFNNNNKNIIVAQCHYYGIGYRVGKSRGKMSVIFYSVRIKDRKRIKDIGIEKILPEIEKWVRQTNVTSTASLGWSKTNHGISIYVDEFNNLQKKHF